MTCDNGIRTAQHGSIILSLKQRGGEKMIELPNIDVYEQFVVVRLVARLACERVASPYRFHFPECGHVDPNRLRDHSR